MIHAFIDARTHGVQQMVVGFTGVAAPVACPMLGGQDPPWGEVINFTLTVAPSTPLHVLGRGVKSSCMPPPQLVTSHVWTWAFALQSTPDAPAQVHAAQSRVSVTAL
jgi:hypothetical protein